MRKKALVISAVLLVLFGIIFAVKLNKSKVEDIYYSVQDNLSEKTENSELKTAPESTAETHTQIDICIPSEEEKSENQQITAPPESYKPKYIPATESENESTTEKPTSAEVLKQEYKKTDKTHFVRSYCYPTKTAYPYIVVIKSTEELKSYYDDNKTVWYFDSKPNGDDSVSFNEAIKKYDNEFFKENALIFVVTEEGSGSVRYSDVTIDGNTIKVRKYCPEVYTCDMAYWHIIIELPKTDPIFSQKKLNVEISE